jgi:hypothetical protein
MEPAMKTNTLATKLTLSKSTVKNLAVRTSVKAGGGSLPESIGGCYSEICGISHFACPQ